MSDNFSFGGDVVWKPDKSYISESNLTLFMKLHGISSFQELMKKSTEDVAWFTDAVIKFLGIKFSRNYSEVVNLSGGIQFPQWCVGGKMNIVETCVDKWAENPDTKNNIVLNWESENGAAESLTYSDLQLNVNKCANALRELEIQKGDVVGLYMPMIPEIVIALLAAAKIGAVILPLFSGYGVDSIAQRLNDSNAKVLFTSDGFFRRGNAVEMKQIVDKALDLCPSVKSVIVTERSNVKIEMKEHRDFFWNEIVNAQSAVSPTEILDAEDTLMIIYTSGTTGKPKGAVHTHCGFPIKAAQDMAFGTDIHKGDTIYWMTDMGWMMGPWLVFGATIIGASFLMYDGAHDFPDIYRLWNLTEKYDIKTLGISPTLIRVLMSTDLNKIRAHNFSHLKFFASTSEPWNPEPWMWLFKDVGDSKRPIINYSGGTEISGGILMGNPIKPLKPASFSAVCPGIAADVFDENGEPVKNQVGELVIKAPWIGMTRGFLNDNERYLSAYWSRWENVWVHGDWAAIDEEGFWFILGRSDETIKVAGKRIGPAEVESSLVSHPFVREAAVIGVPHNIKGNEIVCFCVLGKHHYELPKLVIELKNKIALELGKPLKPGKIFFVQDIPKTRNGKIMRRIIKKAYLGEDTGDVSGLQNPQAVVEINKIA